MVYKAVIILPAKMLGTLLLTSQQRHTLLYAVTYIVSTETPNYTLHV